MACKANNITMCPLLEKFGDSGTKGLLIFYGLAELGKLAHFKHIPLLEQENKCDKNLFLRVWRNRHALLLL